MKLVIIDTETGGLDAHRHSLLQVGLVSWQDGVMVDTDEFYVREELIITVPEAMEINKIDLNVVNLKGLRPAQACTRFNRFVMRHRGIDSDDPDAGAKKPKARLAGWNVAFDRDFLKRMFYMGAEINGIPGVAHRLFDAPTLAFALASCGKLDIPVDKINSDTVFSYFGCNPSKDKRHSAESDALATGEIITRMLVAVRDGKPAVDKRC